MDNVPALTTITFDCTDAAALAGFWSTVLDRPVADGADAVYASIPGAPGFAFLQVPEPKATKNRVHPDLSVADLAAAVDRAVALGAQKVRDVEEEGERWTTLTDPEGNEFDLVALNASA